MTCEDAGPQHEAGAEGKARRSPISRALESDRECQGEGWPSVTCSSQSLAMGCAHCFLLHRVGWDGGIVIFQAFPSDVALLAEGRSSKGAALSHQQPTFAAGGECV